MDMVFVYEDRIAQDEAGNYYTGTAFSQEIFDRYLQYFDHITLLMRKAQVNKGDTETLSLMNRINSDHINVVILPDMTASVRAFLNPRLRAEFKSTVLNELTPNRAVIIRAPSDSGTVAADHCHANGIPYLVEAVGCPWDSLWNHSIKGKILAPGAWNGFRRTMRNADYAIYVTTKFLQNRYPTNGRSAAVSDVELQPMNEDVLNKRIEKIRNSSGTVRLATAAAVDTAYKGQQFVIEALAKLKKQGDIRFEYHLAGGGDPSTLQNLACRLGVEDQVCFDGSLPHEAMFSWLDGMDVYIQPSLQEGLPRAVIEAMSRALPIFGARTGGIPELLGNNCIFPRKNPDAVASKLSRLTTEQMITMAQDNFRHAQSFQKERLEKKRNEIYSEFVMKAKESSK